MKPENFSSLKYFTQAEVEKTGADISGLKFVLMITLDSFREKLGNPIKILQNGLNSGEHSETGQHPKGGAVDCYFKAPTHKTVTGALTPNLNTTVELALDAGFTGICLNGRNKGYLTMHLDIRGKSWLAKRVPGVGYVDLI